MTKPVKALYKIGLVESHTTFYGNCGSVPCAIAVSYQFSLMTL